MELVTLKQAFQVVKVVFINGFVMSRKATFCIKIHNFHSRIPKFNLTFHACIDMQYCVLL